MAISIRLSDQDNQLIRKTVMEHIEDEIDIQAYKAAMVELEEDPTTYSMDEVKVLLEL